MKVKALKIMTLVFCALIVMLSFASCKGEKATDRSEEYDMIQAVDELNLADGNGEYILVSFPGLGVEPIVINKVAFSIGNFSVRWDSLLVLIGSVLALVYAFFKRKREEISISDFLDIGLWGIIAAVVGSRLYYVLASSVSFKGRFFDIFKFWEGGNAVYGAFIGCIIAIAIVCKLKKIKVLRAYDMAAPAFMVGQIIGRWGDLISGKSYGYEVESGSVFYWLRMGLYPHTNEGIFASSNRFAYVHPVFLYESLWNLFGFIIINLFYLRKKKFDGQIFFMYLAWYGVGRIFTEILRTDSLYIFGTIRMSLLVGCLSFFAGVALLIYGAILGKKQRLAKEEYESAYPLFGTKFSREEEKEKKKENTETLKEEDNKNEVD